MVADDRQDRGHGVRVQEVVDGAPAARAGLLVGDLIIAIDGRPVRQMSDLAAAIQGTPPLSNLTFDVVRGDETRKIRITSGRRPTTRPPKPTNTPADQPVNRSPEQPTPIPNQPAAQPGPMPMSPGPGVATQPQAAVVAQRPLLGIVGKAAGAEITRFLRLPAGHGVVVSRVLANSPAAAGGLAPGDVLLAIDGQAVLGPDQLAGLLSQKAGQQIDLVSNRRGRMKAHRIALPAIDVGLGESPVPMPPPAAVEVLPNLQDKAPAASDQERVKQLDKEVEQLRQRLAELEKKLQRP